MRIELRKEIVGFACRIGVFASVRFSRDDTCALHHPGGKHCKEKRNDSSLHMRSEVGVRQLRGVAPSLAAPQARRKALQLAAVQKVWKRSAKIDM